MSEHAIGNAKAWLETIKEQVAAMYAADDACDDNLSETTREDIQSSPLDVQVRYGWTAPGNGPASTDEGPEEYMILLSMGGPALRIYGNLADHGTPDEWPHLQWQDWGTPWTDLPLGEEREAVAAWASQFFFGE